jgi:glutathione synthase/RimK-type ligase-like ATP-grasp enzyme
LDPVVAQKVHKVMSYYKLEFAAIDFAVVDDGEPVFLELNPNGQWLWLQYMTGVNLADPFIDFLCN